MSASMELLIVFGLILLIIVIIALIIFALIVKKAGYSGWWALMILIPVINLAMIWVFAFAEWPAEKA